MMHPDEKSMKQALQIRDSLDIAMDIAGGGRLTLASLEEMSALDLLILLSSNEIKFVCLPKN